MKWIDANTPPTNDQTCCKVKMNDGSVRDGNACHDPDGRFAGWMFECLSLDPSEANLEVVAWGVDNGGSHASDCATNNGPALPTGDCDCKP